MPVATANPFLDDSLNIELNNTFDRLQKCEDFNPVSYTKEVINISSDYESIHDSISRANVQTFLCSPVIRNLNKRKRNARKVFLPKKFEKKETTLERSINESLFIEFEKPKEIKDESKTINEYLQKDENMKNNGIISNTESLKLNESIDTSVQFIENASQFSNVICSTPLIHGKKLLKNQVSSLVANNEKLENSFKPHALLGEFIQYSEQSASNSEKCNNFSEKQESLNKTENLNSASKDMFDVSYSKSISAINRSVSLLNLSSTSLCDKSIKNKEKVTLIKDVSNVKCISVINSTEDVAHSTKAHADIEFLGFPSMEEESDLLLSLSDVTLDEFSKCESLFKNSSISEHLSAIDEKLNKSVKFITLRRRNATVDGDTNKLKKKLINLDISNASFNINLSQKHNYSTTENISSNKANVTKNSAKIEVGLLPLRSNNSDVNSQADKVSRISGDYPNMKQSNQICILPNINEINESNENMSVNFGISKYSFRSPNPVVLKAGKWRRSLLKRNSVMSTIENKG